jgi:hypothetical protein
VFPNRSKNHQQKTEKWKTTMSKKKPATKPRAKKPRKARVGQPEMPLTGVGVEVITDRTLIELGNLRVEESETIGTARAELKKIDADILNRMNVLGLKIFRVEDRIFKNHEKHVVKIVKYKDEPPTPESTVPEASPTETGA